VQLQLSYHIQYIVNTDQFAAIKVGKGAFVTCDIVQRAARRDIFFRVTFVNNDPML